jgi:hypothetical protein
MEYELKTMEWFLKRLSRHIERFPRPVKGVLKRVVRSMERTYCRVLVEYSEAIQEMIEGGMRRAQSVSFHVVPAGDFEEHFSSRPKGPE